MTTLTAAELKKLRALCEELGVAAAARTLHVHRTSIMSILAGEAVRPNTEFVIKSGLK